MSKRTCSTDGCDREHYARGFCNPHYQTWKRVNPEATTPHGSLTYMQRFWAKVDKSGPVPEYRPELGPCWIWTGAINARTGYGNFGRPQKLPHRISYEVTVGPIPKPLEIDHLCRVRHCVRPEHLEAVTKQVNQLRSESVSAISAAKTACDNGHAFDEANTAFWNGMRRCRACARARSRDYRARLAADRR